jgi:hypothetical protein
MHVPRKVVIKLVFSCQFESDACAYVCGDHANNKPTSAYRQLQAAFVQSHVGPADQEKLHVLSQKHLVVYLAEAVPVSVRGGACMHDDRL